MRFSAPRRALVSAVVLLCVLHSAVGVGIVGGVSAESPASGQAPFIAQQTDTPVNNTSVQQEDPDEVDEQGDSNAVRSYLAQKLAERLGESSAQISQGQYEQGQAVLGDEYNDLLEKYVDVEGGTGENPAAESFEEANENQRTYGSAVAEYNETYQEYQEAKDAGNSTRARELARELDRIADRVNSSGQNLTRSYAEVENTTGSDLSEASENVQNTSREIQEQHDEVVSATFVRTTLSATTNGSTVSFENPATIHGQLVLANGTALDNETVEIRVGGRTEAVRTDGEGQFTVNYRPVRTSKETELLEVTYLPVDSSVYLGSNASVDVNISQVVADLTVSTNVSAVQFGDPVTVSGRAQVNGTPVSGARVRVMLGGYTIGTAMTDANGTYRLTTRLPESVSNGEATVQSTIVPADAAVRSEPVTTSVQVNPTPVSLALNATRVSGSQLQLSGVLQTDDGRPLAGQTVELRVGGTTVATVDTRRDGTFERTVSISESLSGTVTVRAVYDEPSTNIEQATAQARVNLDTGTVVEERLALSPELLGGGGIVVVALLVIGWLVRRSDEEVVSEAPSSTSEAPSSTGSEVGTDIVEQASSLLSAGDSETAIRALYAAVRESLGSGDGSLTHWEFYTAASEGLDQEATGTLEQLTEAYERVVYSAEGVDADVAEQLLEESEELIGEGFTEGRNAE